MSGGSISSELRAWIGDASRRTAAQAPEVTAADSVGRKLLIAYAGFPRHLEQSRAARASQAEAA